MYVYLAFRDLKRRDDAVLGERWWEDPVTGKELQNAISIHEETELGRQQSVEFQAGVYEYGRHFAYPLDIGCNGRDWHDVLRALVGYDRNGPKKCPLEGPFAEILHWAYSLVTFGPIASAKVVADFDAWDARARSFSDAEFYLAYWAVRTCFSHAAQNGAVQVVWQTD